MKPIHLIILLYATTLFACSKVNAQAIHKTKYNINGLTFNYCCMEPTGKVKGIVVLLPGAGEAIKSVFSKTKLPQLLAAKGFITIVPEIHTLLYTDQYSIDVLNAVIRQAQQKFNILSYVIGGFSAGGAIATRYAEYVLAKDTLSALKGLIVVDGPLDLERLYTTAEHMIASCSGIIKKEGYRIKAQLEQVMGGPPQLQPQKYQEYASFIHSIINGGNASHLKDLPIRLYSEPDLDFIRKTYCSELTHDDINSCDLERLNMFLQSIGNTKTEYITTQCRGFHSWNIIEPLNCADWITAICQ